MGNFTSQTESDDAKKKEQPQPQPQDDFGAWVRNAVNDEIARRAMRQREIQMAVNIARARDTLFVFGSAWGVLAGSVATAKALGKTVPPVAGIPLVVGGLVLGNMYDLAYGNKMLRVAKEAEHILEHERGRFVPFRQAPFSKFYTDEERAALFESATAVGDLFPNSLYAPRRDLPPPPPPAPPPPPTKPEAKE